MQKDVRVGLIFFQHEWHTCLSLGDSSKTEQSLQKEGKKTISKNLILDNVSFNNESFKKPLPLLSADRQYKEGPMERHSVFFLRFSFHSSGRCQIQAFRSF
jgi:hypothetical protein